MADEFQAACIRAERACFQEFVRRTPLPKIGECVDILKLYDQTHHTIAEFGIEQYRALQSMWTSEFAEDVVSSYSKMMDKNRMYALNDAIGFILNHLCQENAVNVKNKKVSFRGDVEIINAGAVIQTAHKYFVRPFWGLDV